MSRSSISGIASSAWLRGEDCGACAALALPTLFASIVRVLIVRPSEAAHEPHLSRVEVIVVVRPLPLRTTLGDAGDYLLARPQAGDDLGIHAAGQSDDDLALLARAVIVNHRHFGQAAFTRLRQARLAEARTTRTTGETTGFTCLAETLPHFRSRLASGTRRTTGEATGAGEATTGTTRETATRSAHGATHAGRVAGTTGGGTVDEAECAHRHDEDIFCRRGHEVDLRGHFRQQRAVGVVDIKETGVQHHVVGHRGRGQDLAHLAVPATITAAQSGEVDIHATLDLGH